ncbi:hypothetical protein [Helicobacter pylori]|nr:hypothetical protein [Helicobacter pylori]
MALNYLISLKLKHTLKLIAFFDKESEPVLECFLLECFLHAINW